jgi:hypothetical protein
VINLCVPFRENSAEEGVFVMKISTLGMWAICVFHSGKVLLKKKLNVTMQVIFTLLNVLRNRKKNYQTMVYEIVYFVFF